MKYTEELMQKAIEGDAESQYELAWMYQHGEGIIQDNGEAVKWYTKAAKQGHGKAQYSLARIYEGGMYNYEEAVKWYTKAAEQGDIRAQTSLAWMYDQGKGVAKDHKEAAKWFRRVANNGT